MRTYWNLTPSTGGRDPSRYAARGAGLIEVLIALFVVAIGLLGIASLQFMSLRSNFEAVQRTTASLLAQDIIERMRANYKVLDTYAGTLETPLPSLGGNPAASEPQPTCYNSASTCTPLQLAAHDLWEWEQAIDGVAESDTATAAYTGGLTLPTACLYSKVSDTAATRSGSYFVAIVWRGPTEMSNPTNPVSGATPDPYTCGQNSGKYNGANGTDTHRRILVVEAFFSASER